MNALIYTARNIDNELKQLIAEGINEETGEFDESIFEDYSSACKDKVAVRHNMTRLFLGNKDIIAVLDEQMKKVRNIKANLVKFNEDVKAYVASITEEGEKTQFGDCKVSWRKSESVEVEPDLDIKAFAKTHPELVKITIEVDKTAIKELNKAGLPIPEGTKVVKKNNIQLLQ